MPPPKPPSSESESSSQAPGPKKGRKSQGPNPQVVFLDATDHGDKITTPGFQSHIRSTAIRNAKAGWKIKPWSDTSSDADKGGDSGRRIRAPPKATAIQTVDSIDSQPGAVDELHMSRFRVRKPAARSGSRSRRPSSTSSSSRTPKSATPDPAPQQLQLQMAMALESSLSLPPERVLATLSSRFGDHARKLFELCGYDPSQQESQAGVPEIFYRLYSSRQEPWMEMAMTSRAAMHAFIAYAASQPGPDPVSPGQEQAMRYHLGAALMESSSLLAAAHGPPDHRVCFVLFLLLIIARRLGDDAATKTHLQGLVSILRVRRSASPNEPHMISTRILLALTTSDWIEPATAPYAIECSTPPPDLSAWASGGASFTHLASAGLISFDLGARSSSSSSSAASPVDFKGKRPASSSPSPSPGGALAPRPDASLEEIIYQTSRATVHVALFGRANAPCAHTLSRFDAVSDALRARNVEEMVRCHAPLVAWVCLSAAAVLESGSVLQASFVELLGHVRGVLDWGFEYAVRYFGVQFRWVPGLTAAARDVWENGVAAGGLESDLQICACAESPGVSLVLLPVVVGAWDAEGGEATAFEEAETFMGAMGGASGGDTG